MIALEAAPRPPIHMWAPALLAVGVARLAVRRDPRRLRAFLTRASRGARPATARETARARSHVVGSSMRCAGPRCLERSVATALLCRLTGTWPDWCTGVTVEPFNAHAWVEAEGRPIGENDREIALFATTMRVTCAGAAAVRDEEASSGGRR